MLPYVGPRAQCYYSESHNYVGDIGERVQTDQSKNTGNNVKHDNYGDDNSRRASSFEDIFTFVVSFKCVVIIFNILRTTINYEIF